MLTGLAPKEFTVGEGNSEIRFSIAPLSSTLALSTFNRFLDIFGPALSKGLGQGLGNVKDMGDLLNMDLGALLSGTSEGITLLFQKLKPEVQDGLVKTLLSNAQVYLEDEQGQKLVPLFSANGRGHPFDIVFAGRLLDLMSVLAFAWRLNYGDFWNALSAFVSHAQRRQQTQKTTSKESST